MCAASLFNIANNSRIGIIKISIFFTKNFTNLKLIKNALQLVTEQKIQQKVVSVRHNSHTWSSERQGIYGQRKQT